MYLGYRWAHLHQSLHRVPAHPHQIFEGSCQWKTQSVLSPANTFPERHEKLTKGTSTTRKITWIMKSHKNRSAYETSLILSSSVEFQFYSVCCFLALGHIMWGVFKVKTFKSNFTLTSFIFSKLSVWSKLGETHVARLKETILFVSAFSLMW